MIYVAHMECTQLYDFLIYLSPDQIWLQLEIKQLASAFSKLKKLSILGVFVEFDLLWTTAFLGAARYVEILHIEVNTFTIS